MNQQLYRSRRLFNRRYHGPLFNAAWEAIVWAGARIKQSPLPVEGVRRLP